MHLTLQWMEPSFTIHFPCFFLSVYTLGRVSKLSRLLHKEIKPSDVPINGRLDGWVSYLDEQPPRGMLALPHHCYRDRGGKQQRWLSRSPRSHSEYTMHQTNPKEIMQQALTTDWRVRKIRKTNTLLHFNSCSYLHVCKTVWDYTVTHDDYGSLKKKKTWQC